MKLDYTISRFFQEMSLSETEKVHHLCELVRTKILQSLALAVLKNPMQDLYYQTIDHISLTTNEKFSVTTRILKTYHHCTLLKII